MNLQRVKELLAAWEAGAAREDELAELRRLLPDVIEAAETPSHDDSMKEAECVLELIIPNRDAATWKAEGLGIVLILIAMGIRREARVPQAP